MPRPQDPRLIDVLAKRLAASDDATARWIGKDAVREFAPVGTR